MENGTSARSVPTCLGDGTSSFVRHEGKDMEDGRQRFSGEGIMYSPKRRFRLFRHPAWAGGGEIDDSTVYTYTWAEQTGAPSQRYAAISVDDTGDTMITAQWSAAASANQGTWVSTDSGATWTRKITGMTFVGSTQTNNPVFARSNPNIAYVTNTSDYLYKSINKGDTWTAITGSAPFNAARMWNCVHCSSDGTNVVAAITGGAMYKSTNGGTTWTELTGAGTTRAWDEVIISDDGQVIAGCAFNAFIYVSTNGGTTWTSNTGEGQRLWRGLSASSDGRVLFASSVTGALPNGGAVLSKDSGQTWTEVTSSVGGTGDYWDTATSINGAKLVVARTTGSIHISQDGGTTWSAQATPGTGKTWDGIGMSPDGKTIIVGRNTGRPWVATGS